MPLAAADREIDGRAVRIEVSELISPQESRMKRSNDPTGEPTNTLFIGNLSFKSTEEGIRAAFEEDGLYCYYICSYRY